MSYSIQTIARITGISIHTLRTWEKRYQCVTPDRKDNGHRVYSEEDLTKLNLLQAICKLGEPISSVANKNIPELETLYKAIGGQQNIYVTNNEKVEPIDYQNKLNELQIALAGYRLDIISHELEKLKLTLNYREFVFKVISPLLKEIGQKVMREELSIAQEHALSSIIKFQLGQILFQNYEKNYRKKSKIALATPNEEFHEFGILLASILCFHHNIQFIYLGANLPAQSYVEASKALEIDVLVLGTTANTNNGREGFTTSYLKELVQGTGANQEVWFGGDAPFDLAQFQKHRRFHFLSTLEHFDSYLSQLK